jgi:hypothetical protein
VTEFTNLTTEELFSTPEFKAAVLAAAGGGGGGLEGTNYIYVAANGTDVENAAELQAAYTTAQGMSPSATNRITIVAAPGYYNFGFSLFIMSTEYIDLVSLDGNRSIIFNSSDPGGTIALNADNIYVKGVDTQTKGFYVLAGWAFGMKVENCKGGDDSFHNTGSGSGGTFIDCDGGDRSFASGSGSIAAGVYINCTAGIRSFGNKGTASGIFKNCTAGGGSFGANDQNQLGSATATGIFENCVCTGDTSFGSALYFTTGMAAGTFTNCTAIGNAFGSVGVASGIFTNCTTQGSNTFADSGTASGTFRNCIAYGSGNFASSGTFSGKGYYCVGSWPSFARSGTITGQLYYCKTLGAFSSFGGVSGSGKIRLCIDGDENIVNAG